MEPKDVCKARRDAASSLRDSVKRDEWLDVAVAKAVGSACGGFKAQAFGDVLAELVDQPTCTMDATDSTYTVDGEMVLTWECSRCGETCEEVNGRYEFVNTLFTDEWYSPEAMEERGVVQAPLCYLAKSLENMSKCHAAYFCKGWEKARGCRIEHDAAAAYGLEVLYED